MTLPVFTIFALIFQRTGFMAVCFLTTSNKNPSDLVPVPAIYCDKNEGYLKTKLHIWGCKATGYIRLGGGGQYRKDPNYSPQLCSKMFIRKVI